MRMNWTAEELAQSFTIQSDEHEFLGLNAPHNHLGKAVLLKYFQHEARFPQDKSDIPQAITTFIAQQLYLSPEVFSEYKWEGSRMREHRQMVREWLGFRRSSLEDQKAVRDWLLSERLPNEHRPTHLQKAVYDHLREHNLEPPSDDQVTRLVTSAIYQYQRNFFEQTYKELPQSTRTKLRNLLSEASNWAEQTSGYDQIILKGRKQTVVNFLY